VNVVSKRQLKICPYKRDTLIENPSDKVCFVSGIHLPLLVIAALALSAERTPATASSY
jgi:hypothetical protein